MRRAPAVSYTHLDVYKRQAIVNLLQLAPGEKITAMIPIHEYSDDKNLFMVCLLYTSYLGNKMCIVVDN